MGKLTNFTNGISSFGIPIYGGAMADIPPGNVYFVDSNNGANGNSGTSKASAWNTIAYAVGRVSAGDTVVACIGHTETISSATALACEVASVRFIALGSGDERATLTFDTATTAAIPVSAANVVWQNFIITANFADIVAPFTTTTAKNLQLLGCRFKATATNMNFLNIVDTSTTDNAADGLTIQGCRWIEPDTATLQMVKADGTIDRLTILDNKVQLGVKNNTPALLAVATGKIATNLDMGDNRVFRLNTDTATGAILATTDGTTNSGLIYGNFVQHADTAAELLITANAGWGTFNNYASGVVGASGFLLPAADS